MVYIYWKSVKLHKDTGKRITGGQPAEEGRRLIDRNWRDWETIVTFGSKSSRCRGRLHETQPCEIRTEFQRDRQDSSLQIIPRLKHKTQVFISPEDHYRTALPIPLKYHKLLVMPVPSD